MVPEGVYNLYNLDSEVKILTTIYLKCLNHNFNGALCPGIVFHGKETQLSDISPDAQLYLAYRQSIETIPGKTIFCQVAGCQTLANKPRTANRQCQRFPVCCSQCCQLRGGCKIHKSSGVSGSQAHVIAPTDNTVIVSQVCQKF